MTYLSLGILKRSQGKFEEAETLFLKALNIDGEASVSTFLCAA